MKPISEQKQKQIMLDILIYVAKFCENNNIRYSISYGTLIGAIRHKGFIPWDDDIDILMPREDYERFKELYQSDVYILSDMLNNPKHPTGVTKVYDNRTFYYRNQIKREIGLFIDVFVADKAPLDKNERVRCMKTIKRLSFICSMKNSNIKEVLRTKNSFKEKIIALISRLLPYPKRTIQNKINNLTQQYNSSNSDYYWSPITGYNVLFPIKYFDKFVDVSFEGHQFKAISEYDNFLKSYYGDYMQLPPEEKRHGKHDIVAFFK